MSRAKRSQLLYPGCYAHIISRSIRKEKVFKEPEDFKYFVVQIFSWEEFAKALNYLKKRYVFYYHAKYRLSGPIWRERYKSLLIEDELYLHTCVKKFLVLSNLSAIYRHFIGNLSEISYN